MVGRRVPVHDGGVTATHDGWALAADPSLTEETDVAGALGVDPALGLTTAEAADRLGVGGPNIIRRVEPERAWRRLLRQFRDPLVLLLLAAVVVAVFAWWVDGATGLPVDALVISAIVLADAVIGYVQESRAADAVAALAELTAPTATVLRDRRLVTVPAATVVVGDVLSLAEGAAVAADARLVTATGLRVQEASLTGESAAVDKCPDALDHPTVPGDRVNMTFAGTAVVEGVGLAVVTATGMDTEMGSIARLLESTESEPSPLQREIAAVSRGIGAAVLAIAVVVMAAVALVDGVDSLDDVVTVLLFGVSLAVAAVPEGLPAILTLVLAIGVRAMARRQAIVKRLHSVETLGSATVVCSDKTGTLTRGEMTLRVVLTPTGTVELSGAGYRPDGAVRVVTHRDGMMTDAAVLEAAARVLVGGVLANNAQLDASSGQWRVEGDPTEASFLVAAAKLDGVGERAAAYERLGEVPFTSQRRMMSVLVVDPTGRRVLVTKGAPDVVLRRCSAVLTAGTVRALGSGHAGRCLADVDDLSAQGYRVLAVAYRVLGPEEDGLAAADLPEDRLVYAGAVGIVDPPREEAIEAVAQARRAGLRVVMLTGDHPRTGAAVAADLGIVGRSASAVAGTELDDLDDAALADLVGHTSVFARVAPEHKLRIVRALQSRGHTVAMTGDGVNDAPALKAADIGIAMGIAGTEVSKDAAAMVLGNDDFATIIAAVRQGRLIVDNITKFLRYLLSSNMGEVVTVIAGIVLGGALGLTGGGGNGEIVLPLLATQILWINLVTDAAPALALGVDPEIDDVMARPPRPSTARLLDRPMWTTILWAGLVMGGSTLLAIDACLPGGLVQGSADLATARTAGFTTLVLAQLFNLLNTRSATSSALRHLLVGRWLWAAVALGVVLQVAVVEVPVLATAFGAVPLSGRTWLMCVALASVVLWVGELVKVVRRGRLRRSGHPASPAPGSARRGRRAR